VSSPVATRAGSETVVRAPLPLEGVLPDALNALERADLVELQRRLDKLAKLMKVRDRAGKRIPWTGVRAESVLDAAAGKLSFRRLHFHSCTKSARRLIDQQDSLWQSAFGFSLPKLIVSMRPLRNPIRTRRSLTASARR